MAKYLGFKSWPTPVIKPFWPYFLGMAVSYYGVCKLQAAMLDTETWRNDPRSPTYVHKKKEDH